jgi:maltose-binding protein MalE
VLTACLAGRIIGAWRSAARAGGLLVGSRARPWKGGGAGDLTRKEGNRMELSGLRKRATRRAFVASFAAAGSAVLLAACGAPPPPTKPAVSAPKPAEPSKPADAAKPADKPAVAAMPATPTPPPVLTPIPMAAGLTKVLMRVHWSGVNFNEFQKILNEYNSTQGPKDKIYLTLERFVAGSAGPIATFIADFQAGTQEDIYHLAQSQLPDLAARGFFSAPPQEVQSYIKDNYLSSAVATGTIDGKVMGYPTENQPHMMFVNKTMFAEAKLDPVKDFPKKWDDIRRIAKELTKKDASGLKTQAGFIVHFQQGSRVIHQRLVYQFLNGTPLIDTTKTPPVWDLTSDGARAFTELIGGMQKDGSLSGEMGPPENVWPNRGGAMITHDAWAVIFELVNRGKPGSIDEMQTGGLYSADGTKTGNMSRNYHFLVSSKSKAKDESWKHLVWMNHGPEFRMQAFQTHLFGFVASVKNYDLPKVFIPQMKDAFADSLKQPNQTILPPIRGMTEAQNIMRDFHDGLVLGKMTTAEYTTKLDEELKKAMASAYA